MCRTGNTDTVVVEIHEDNAEISIGLDGEVIGKTTVTTTPQSGDRIGVIQERNFASRIADEVRRKRPEEVYIKPEGDGDSRNVLHRIRSDLRHKVYRVGNQTPEDLISEKMESALEVVNEKPENKIGGKHSTLIGDRKGMRAVKLVAEHPHVKKIVPGPISAGGQGSRDGFNAKITRPDNNGNVRLLLRNGSSVQENRVITTARDLETGRRVAEDLNQHLESD